VSTPSTDRLARSSSIRPRRAGRTRSTRRANTATSRSATCSSATCGCAGCNAAQRAAPQCTALQHKMHRVATQCTALQQCAALQHNALRCNTMRRAATKCAALQPRTFPGAPHVRFVAVWVPRGKSNETWRPAAPVSQLLWLHRVAQLCNGSRCVATCCDAPQRIVPQYNVPRCDALSCAATCSGQSNMEVPLHYSFDAQGGPNTPLKQHAEVRTRQCPLGSEYHSTPPLS
jgi:hypothetical protein